MDVLPTAASAVQILIQSQKLNLKARVAQIKQVELVNKGFGLYQEIDSLFS